MHSNYFDGGGAPGGQATSYGVRLDNANNTNFVIVGRFINNIILSGSADYRYSFSESNVTIDPELLEGNDFYVSVAGTPIFSALYDDESLVLLMTLAGVNALPENGSTANISADPMVVLAVPGSGDFHLMSGSPCIGAGSSTELPAFDFEGDSRPMGGGPDIGVDEL